jgi:hypothetical protein
LGDDGARGAHDDGAMLLAYDYPLLDIFFSMLWFFLLLAWFMTLFHVIGDIFRSQDMGGWGKALWLIFVIVMPFLGVLIYLIARGNQMSQHAISDAQAQDAAMRAYVRDAAASPADELVKLAQLKDQGVISEAEFATEKAKLLA